MLLNGCYRHVSLISCWSCVGLETGRYMFVLPNSGFERAALSRQAKTRKQPILRRRFLTKYLTELAAKAFRHLD
jgi:hypothetical protein